MNKHFLQAGQRLARAFSKTLKEIKAGVRLSEVEDKAVEYIKMEKGQPGFKRVDNYDWATCININDGVVHGVPNELKVKPGDVVSLDMGLFYRGWHSDMAYTKLVKSDKFQPEADEPLAQKVKSEENIRKFLQIGEEALEEAIRQVKPGNRVGHISKAIEEIITGADYQVIPRLTGHGIGRRLHQEPMIPGFLTGPIEKTPLLEEGMGLAIEVIYTQGKPRIKTAKDGWTITTQDGKISALFEKTVTVTKNGVQIITPYLF